MALRLLAEPTEEKPLITPQTPSGKLRLLEGFEDPVPQEKPDIIKNILGIFPEGTKEARAATLAKTQTPEEFEAQIPGMSFVNKLINLGLPKPVELTPRKAPPILRAPEEGEVIRQPTPEEETKIFQEWYDTKFAPYAKDLYGDQNKAVKVFMQLSPVIPFAFTAPLVATGMLGYYEGKNYLISNLLGEPYSPKNPHSLKELITPDAPESVKMGIAALEMVGDISLMAGAVNLAKRGLLNESLKIVGNKLEQTGYGKEKITIPEEAIKQAVKGTTLEAEASRLVKAVKYKPEVRGPKLPGETIIPTPETAIQPPAIIPPRPEISAPLESAISPVIAEAQKAGKVIGIDAMTKLPVIDTTVKVETSAPVTPPAPASVVPQAPAKPELRLLAEPEEMAPAPEEKIHPPEEPKIETKEPWQMTKEELQNESEIFSSFIKKREKEVLASGLPITAKTTGVSTLTEKEFDRFTSINDELNRRIRITPEEAKKRVLEKRKIRQALSEGKPVSPEVLKDYPELKPEIKLPTPEPKPLIASAKQAQTEGEYITLYHATRKPLNIKREGILPSEAGVINKEGKKLVYTSDNPIKAIEALDYEEALKEQAGQALRKAGDVFIAQIKVPRKDIIIKPNGDIVLNRKVNPNEIEHVLPKKDLTSIWEKAKAITPTKTIPPVGTPEYMEYWKGLSPEQQKAELARRKAKPIIEEKLATPEEEELLDFYKAKGYSVKEGQSIYYEVRDKIPRGTVPSESGKTQIHSFISSSPLKLKFKKQGYFSFPKEKVSSPADAAFAFQQLKNEAVERFYIIGLKNDTPIFIEPLAIGIIDRAPVSPYEALPLLASKKADSFYLVHNHPGGNINPSSDDIASSKAFKEALRNINIQFKGHIVIDDTKFGFIYPETFYNTVIEHLPPQEAIQKVPVYSKYIEWTKSIEELTKLSEPEAIFDFVKSLNIDWKDNALVLYTNNNLKITGSELLPIKKITGKELAKSATSARAMNIFLVNSKLTAPELYEIQGDLDPFSITLLDQVDFKDGNTFVSANAEGMLRPKRIKETKSVKEAPQVPEGMTEEEYYGKNYIPEEIKKETDALNYEYKKSLFKAILSHGGIKISPGIKEEMQGIPIRLLRKDGMYPDDMATELVSSGFRFEGADDLIAQIKQLETFIRAPAKTAKIGQAHIGKIIQTITTPPEPYEWPAEMGPRTGGFQPTILPPEFYEWAEAKGIETRGMEQRLLEQKFYEWAEETGTSTFGTQLLLGKPSNPDLASLATQAQRAYVHILATQKRISPTQLHRLERIYLGKKTMAAKGKEPMSKEEADKLIEVLKGIVPGRGERPPRIPKTTELVPSEFARREIGVPGISKWFFEPWYIFKRIGIWNEVGKPIYGAEEEWRKKVDTKADILRDWLKEVGKSEETAKRLWEYADNSISAEDLTKMTDAEKAVAEKWKTMAEEYADRLHLSYDKRLPHYISHIVEDTFRSYIKENYPPEDLMAILENIHTKEIYDPFLQKRLGFPIVEKNFWRSAYAYIRSAERKIAYDPVLRQVNAFINVQEGKRLLPAQTIKYIEGVIKYQLLGRPSDQEKTIKTTLDKVAKLFRNKKVKLPPEMATELGIETIEVPRVIIPGRPATSLISKVKEANYLSLIAGNLRTTIINLTQPVGTLAKLKGWPHQTISDMAYGYLKTVQYVFQPSFWRKMREAGLIEDMTTFLEGLRPEHQIIGMHIKDLLFWNMKFSEFINRVASGFAGAKNKVRWGDTEELIRVLPALGKKAETLDKELSDLINFRYGALYRPTISTNPLGQIAYHLNSFNLKHLQLLHSLIEDMDFGKWGENWREDFRRDPLKFLKQLSTDDRGAFIRYIIYASLLSLSLGMGISLTQGKSGMLDARLGENPLWKTFIHLVTLNGEELKKDLKQFLPLRGAIKRIKKVIEEGPTGLISTGKPKKEEKLKLLTTENVKTL